MILHVPHSSKTIPNEAGSRFLISEKEIEAELLAMTDHYTDDIFHSDAPEVLPIIYPVSRLVVDPERFTDDAEECMAAKGMGVIYTRTSCGTALRPPPSTEEKHDLLDRYYHPHHKNMTTAVKKKLEKNGYTLILDCHSFSSIPLPHEVDQSSDRPDICIGTDAFHTPLWLIETVTDALTGAGFRCCLNKPFNGTFVPSSYYRCNPQVLSVMIELNRALYMDEKTGAKIDNYLSVKSKVGKCLSKTQSRTHAKLKR